MIKEENIYVTESRPRQHEDSVQAEIGIENQVMAFLQPKLLNVAKKINNDIFLLQLINTADCQNTMSKTFIHLAPLTSVSLVNKSSCLMVNLLLSHLAILKSTN